MAAGTLPAWITPHGKPAVLGAGTAAAFIVIVALVKALDPDSDYVQVRFVAEARGQDTDPIDAAYRTLYHLESILAWAQGQCACAAPARLRKPLE